jgi:hypothetical protein
LPLLRADPGGSGRIVLTDITDNDPPREFTRDYAVEHGNRGFDALGLHPRFVPVLRHPTNGHFSAEAVGIDSLGRYVTVMVHVFPPNHIVHGYYYAQGADDPYLQEAEEILRGIEPVVR